MLDFYRVHGKMPNTLLIPANDLEWLTTEEGQGKFTKDKLECWFGLDIMYAAVLEPRVAIL
jgi:hypothetical protein